MQPTTNSFYEQAEPRDVEAAFAAALAENMAANHSADMMIVNNASSENVAAMEHNNNGPYLLASNAIADALNDPARAHINDPAGHFGGDAQFDGMPADLAPNDLRLEIGYQNHAENSGLNARSSTRSTRRGDRTYPSPGRSRHRHRDSERDRPRGLDDYGADHGYGDDYLRRVGKRRSHRVRQYSGDRDTRSRDYSYGSGQSPRKYHHMPPRPRHRSRYNNQNHHDETYSDSEAHYGYHQDYPGHDGYQNARHGSDGNIVMGRHPSGRSMRSGGEIPNPKALMHLMEWSDFAQWLRQREQIGERPTNRKASDEQYHFICREYDIFKRAWRNERLEEFFAAHSTDEWMIERYYPLLSDSRIHAIVLSRKAIYAQYMQMLSNGLLANESFRAAVGLDHTSVLYSDFDAAERADLASRTIVLNPLDLKTPRNSLLTLFSSFPGFVYLTLSDPEVPILEIPPEKRAPHLNALDPLQFQQNEVGHALAVAGTVFAGGISTGVYGRIPLCGGVEISMKVSHRIAWVVFSTSELAQQALNNLLQAMQMSSEELSLLSNCNASLLGDQVPRIGVTFCSAFSHPDRIQHDFAQARELARILDRQIEADGGVDRLLAAYNNMTTPINNDMHIEMPQGTEAFDAEGNVQSSLPVESRQIDTESARAQLDLIIDYLRRVHFVCYYSGAADAESREALLQRYGDRVVRRPRAVNGNAAPDSAAVPEITEHDKRVFALFDSMVKYRYTATQKAMANLEDNKLTEAAINSANAARANAASGFAAPASAAAPNSGPVPEDPSMAQPGNQQPANANINTNASNLDSNPGSTGQFPQSESAATLVQDSNVSSFSNISSNTITMANVDGTNAAAAPQTDSQTQNADPGSETSASASWSWARPASNEVNVVPQGEATTIMEYIKPYMVTSSMNAFRCAVTDCSKRFSSRFYLIKHIAYKHHNLIFSAESVVFYNVFSKDPHHIAPYGLEETPIEPRQSSLQKGPSVAGMPFSSRTNYRGSNTLPPDGTTQFRSYVDLDAPALGDITLDYD